MRAYKAPREPVEYVMRLEMTVAEASDLRYLLVFAPREIPERDIRQAELRQQMIDTLSAGLGFE